MDLLWKLTKLSMSSSSSSSSCETRETVRNGFEWRRFHPFKRLPLNYKKYRTSRNVEVGIYENHSYFIDAEREIVTVRSLLLKLLLCLTVLSWGGSETLSKTFLSFSSILLSDTIAGVKHTLLFRWVELHFQSHRVLLACWVWLLKDLRQSWNTDNSIPYVYAFSPVLLPC